MRITIQPRFTVTDFKIARRIAEDIKAAPLIEGRFGSVDQELAIETQEYGTCYLRLEIVEPMNACELCGRHIWTPYMLSDAAWQEAGFEKKQMICVTCIRQRLQRPLKIEDFTECVLNELVLAIRDEEWKPNAH